ncbi:MAG: hypothetical protein RLZZ524_920 [Pseudomonadota bacterium]
MSWIPILALCGIAGLAAAPASAATPAPVATSSRADPLDPFNPDAAVLPLPHRSVWPGRAAAAATDAEPVDWRAAHEAVRRAGGWRAYAREVAREVPREVQR